MNDFRKLATIRRIAEIKPIEGADLICAYRVDGWWCVSKINEFQVNDLVVYIEPDAFVPTELAPFLSKGKEPKEYNGIKGERLRTVKLKKQISQGLILSLDILIKHDNDSSFPFENWEEGSDVTDILGIQKWEPPVQAWERNGQAKGNFPSFLRKTDQERVQNINLEKLKDHNWFITEKLDGSSMTVYINYVGTENEVTGVTSKNVDLKEDDTNKWWAVAKKYNLIEKLKRIGRNVALQGELVGPDTCGNKYNLNELQFYAFNIFDIDKQEYLLPDERMQILRALDIPSVPVDGKGKGGILGWSVDGLLEYADGYSQLNMLVIREGFVYSSLTDPEVSFKTVSLNWLLKYKE